MRRMMGNKTGGSTRSAEQRVLRSQDRQLLVAECESRPSLWHEVPPELHCHILSFLSPKDLAEASLVCHYMRHIASSDLIWRPRCAPYLANAHIDEDTLPNFPPPSIEYRWKEHYRWVTSRVLFAFFAGSHQQVNASNDMKERLSTRGIACDVVSEVDPLSDNDWVEAVLKMMWNYRVIIYGCESRLSDTSNEKLGNAFAQFVEKGNSIILTLFVNTFSGYAFTGRWQQMNYNPFAPTSALAESMKRVAIPAQSDPIYEPLYTGVTALASEYYQTVNDSNIHKDAKLMGRYLPGDPSGTPFAAELKVSTESGRGQGLVLALNTYSPAVGTKGWVEGAEQRNDHVQLFANACTYALTHSLRLTYKE